VLISFLNALLPLKQNQVVEQVEYLNTELLPAITELKSTIVDIRCSDNHGRRFLVEMQMVWTDSFQSRVLYNACKAFSHQINRGDPYEILSPVYSLNIINDTFSKQSTIWYHHYTLTHHTLPGTFMDGLSFIFIELPNFIPETVGERRLTVLWLRFLKEIKNNTSMIPEELLEVPEIAEAVEALKVSSYSKEELEQYEKYWDIVRLQKSYVVDAFKEGKIEERTEANRDFTIILITNTDFSDEKIGSLVGIDADWVSEIRKELGA
jgi:predicted transposase/invertase (TIGR01784 family)